MAATGLSWDQNQTTFLLVDSSCLDSRMARTKVMPRKGEKGRTKILWMRAVVHTKEWAKGPSWPMHPASPAPQTPQGAEEIMRWIAEAEWLEGVGRLPQLSLTQQLAQMAAEAGSIYIGWGGASQEETLTYHGRQSPLEGNHKGRQG